MKRLILIIIGVLLCTPLYSDMNTYVIGSGGVAAGETYSFYWTADYASDTDKAYIQAGAGTQDGAWQAGVTASTDQNHTNGGSYCGLFDAANEHIRWTVTSDDIINDAEGRMEVWLYPTQHAANSPIFELTNTTTLDSNNLIFAYTDTSSRVFFLHRGNNTTVALTTTATVTENQWNRVRFRWSATNNVISVKIGDGDWENDSDADAVTAFSSDQPDFHLGERHSNANASMYMDDAKVWTTYDAAW